MLAQVFWRGVRAETGTRAILAPDALAQLCRYGWPGNVRELQNAIAALAVAAPTRGRVSARHVRQVLSIQDPASPDAASATLVDARDAFERRVITASLARHGGAAPCGRSSACRARLAKARKGSAWLSDDAAEPQHSRIAGLERA